MTVEAQPSKLTVGIHEHNFRRTSKQMKLTDRSARGHLHGFHEPARLKSIAAYNRCLVPVKKQSSKYSGGSHASITSLHGLTHRKIISFRFQVARRFTGLSCFESGSVKSALKLLRGHRSDCSDLLVA